MTEKDTSQRDLILDAYSRIVRKTDGPGCLGLSPAEAAFCRVMWLEASMDTGGFALFFSDSYGDIASETLESLWSIGASDAAAILRDAMALFGPTGPSRDQDARNEEIARLGPGAEARLSRLDEAFYSQEEALDLLTLAFLRSAGLVEPDATA